MSKPEEFKDVQIEEVIIHQEIVQRKLSQEIPHPKLDTLKNVEKSSFTFYLLVFNACLGTFNMGYCLAYLTLSLSTVFTVIGIPEEDRVAESALISSMVPLGSFIGALLNYFMLLIFSRRTILMIGACTGMLSIFTTIPRRETIVLFRILLGMSNGIASSTLPIYIRELVPPQMFPTLSTMIENNNSLGLLIGQLLGIPFLSPEHNTADSYYWQIVFAVPAVICFIQLLVFIFVFDYDTPQSQISRGNIDEAMRILKDLYKPEFVEPILQKAESDQKKKLESKTSFRDIFSPRYRARLLLGIFLMFIQQWSGIYALFYYAGQVFSKITGGDKVLTTYLTVIIGVSKLISAFVSVPVVKCFGRKTILTYGSLAVFLFNLLISIFSDIYVPGDSIVIICSIYLCIFFFGIGLGPVPWGIVGETMNSDGAWFLVLWRWIWQAIIVYLFPINVSLMDLSKAFLVFVIINFIGAIVSRFVLRETKGLNAEQVDRLYGYNPDQKEQKYASIGNNPPQELETIINAPVNMATINQEGQANNQHIQSEGEQIRT